MAKAHPRHRLLLLLSHAHKKGEMSRIVEIDSGKDIFELHDLKTKEEIQKIEKELQSLKQKVRNIKDPLP